MATTNNNYGSFVATEIVDSEEDRPNIRRRGSGDGCRDPRLGLGPSSTTRWALVVLYSTCILFVGITMSILAPFYTREASLKGVTVVQSGVVFSSVYITEILVMPILSKKITKFGARNLFFGGVMISGIANIAFGFLQWIEDSTVFLTMSFVTRIITAVGDAGLFVSIYPLATDIIEKKYRSTAISVVETACGLGQVAGPTVGGWLYDMEGFYLPFATGGISLIVLGIITASVASRVHKIVTPFGSESSLDKSNGSGNGAKPEPDTKFKDLIRRPAIFIPFALMVISEGAVAWFLPILEPYMNKEFNVTSTTTGVLFSLEGITYATTSPFWGFLLDKGLSPMFGLTFGSVCNVLGLSLVGPAPYLPFIPSNLVSVGGGLFLIGIGVAATFLTALMVMINEGSPEDNEQSRSMITSIWMIGENLGATLGSVIGAASYEELGFQNSLLVVIGMQVLCLTFLPILCRKRRANKVNVETEDLDTSPLLLRA